MFSINNIILFLAALLGGLAVFLFKKENISIIEFPALLGICRYTILGLSILFKRDEKRRSPKRFKDNVIK
jgi:hypothetical protein